MHTARALPVGCVTRRNKMRMTTSTLTLKRRLKIFRGLSTAQSVFIKVVKAILLLESGVQENDFQVGEENRYA